MDHPFVAIADSHPVTLPDLLSNTLVLRQTAPYLPISSIAALAATSKALHDVISQSPDAFRYLDLSTSRSANVHYEPLDCGGISWRAERMDESLTEDEFYSGPLRGIFSKLERLHRLQRVHTLVLDGLSVTADLVSEIISDDKFNVRILSIRDVRNMNERKLQQVLRYAVRPSRPPGTPRVKGIYFFGPPEHPTPASMDSGAGQKEIGRQNVQLFPLRTEPRCHPASQIGAEWNRKSSEALNTALARTQDGWYQSSGRMFTKRPSSEWAQILQACDGIIAFDAVLCRGPRHEPAKPSGHGAVNAGHFLHPAIATVALGPSGCESCHSSPEGPAQFGLSRISELPLLSPIPLHSSNIRTAQMPHTTDGSGPPLLYARCEDCLKGRWCERCQKWWDEDCYTGSTIAQRTELQLTEFIETVHTNGVMEVTYKETIKTIGVRRDCFGCGHTCITCKELFIRRCTKCKNEYCLEDNESSSDTRCDWCNYTCRRTVELY